MSNQPDNILSNRIKEVFDNYEDHSAEAGWLLLRERFPEKKKQKPVAWWLAAATLLIAGAGIWFFAPMQQQMLGYKPRHEKKFDMPELIKQQQKPNDNLIAKSKPQILKSTTLSKAQLLIVNKSLAKQPGSKTKGIGADFNKREPAMSTAVIASRSDQNQVFAGSIPNGIPTSPTTKAITHLAVVSESVAKAQKLTDSAVTKATIAKATPKPKTMQDLLNTDNTRPANRNSNANTARAAKTSVIVSAYAASYFNYAKGSNNQLNIGGGITSDFRVSNRFKFSTGIYVAQNTLSYTNTSIPQAVNSSALAIANSGNYLASAGAASSALGFSATPSINNFNANLLGLDVPLNLKYQFNPDRNDSYVSAGLSSGTYISETYSSAYNYNVFGSSALAQSQETTSRQHFNTFDFAKTLNLSFGIGYPLGKTNRLIVEPFLKYPLGGLGSQNIRFGASGINLKLNLNNQKNQ